MADREPGTKEIHTKRVKNNLRSRGRARPSNCGGNTISDDLLCSWDGNRVPAAEPPPR